MPNEQMAAYWSEQAGPEWVANEDVFDHMLEPFGRAVLDALALTAGESVLDVGCGFGTTAREAAALVGPSGRVVGIDVSPPMIDLARARAAELGAGNVSFVVADAQVHRFDRPVDTIVSRFGVMFFDDPVAAFAHLHSVVRPGGRLAFVCWQEQDRNPWISAPARAWQRHLPETFTPPPPEAPGPFAFASRERVERILSAAGWTDVSVGALETEARMGAGRGIEGAVQQVMATSTGRMLRDSLSAEVMDQAMADLRSLLTEHLRDGEVVFPAAAWVATARR